LKKINKLRIINQSKCRLSCAASKLSKGRASVML
jgi:hypothetical protein